MSAQAVTHTALTLSDQLPALQILVTFIAAPLVVMFGSRRLAWPITFAASALSFVIALVLLSQVIDGSVISYHMGGWAPPLGIEYRVDAANAFALIIAAMSGMIGDMTVNANAMKASTGGGFITATDLADWLVRVLDMPFRNAHHVTGSLVALAENKGCDLDGLTLAEMQTVEAKITQDVFSVLTVESSVASRTSYGGTAPEQVLQQVAAAKKRIE